MKKMSNRKPIMILFMDSISDNVDGRELYKFEVIESCQWDKLTEKEKAEVFKSGPLVTGDDGDYKHYCLNKAGVEVANFFFTLDAINRLNLLKSRTLLGEFDIEEYSILEECGCFVKGDRAIPAQETEGIRFKDLLIHVDFSGSYEGEILSPSEFETAQLRLLRFLNPKCLALSGLHPVKREMIYLTEYDYQHLPVLIDNDMYVVAKSKVVPMFALDTKVYDDDDYAHKYTVRYVTDYFTTIVQALLRRTSVRCEAPSSN